jgi:hypothetical protein
LAIEFKLRLLQNTSDLFELYRIHGVSEQSYYRWKKTSKTRELKQLREENVKLKRLVADLGVRVRVAGYRSEFDFMKFADLSLPLELIAALARRQILDPSPIQIAAIPPPK